MSELEQHLLAALTDDYAPIATIRPRCRAAFDDHTHLLDVMAGLIQRGLVDAGLWCFHAYQGMRHSYRLTEAGRARKDRQIDPRSRNQELFAHA